jgi:prophage regulatory protein
MSLPPAFAGIHAETIKMSLALLKLPEVCRRRAQRPTSIYAAIKAGLLVPPIKLTERSSAWVEHEVDAINAAMIAGKSAAEIRELVAQLVTARRGSQQPVGEKQPTKRGEVRRGQHHTPQRHAQAARARKAGQTPVSGPATRR